MKRFDGDVFPLVASDKDVAEVTAKMSARLGILVDAGAGS